MSRILENITPDKPFYFFEELSKIPRASKNTKAVSDYCVRFAKDRNLEVIQDAYGNVIIKKDATYGREKDTPVIIQGHLDMVAEKEQYSSHDFDNDPLELLTDGEYIYAKDTTLGGDDGIAIAMALAILDDESVSHPALEAVFTVDEEIGMLGAKAIDFKQTKGNYLLNIDSEVEGILTVGCAGGARILCRFGIEREQVAGLLVTVTLSGLKGGHSGIEIDKERGNAIKLMGRLLHLLSKKMSVRIVNLYASGKDNAISHTCSCDIFIRSDNELTILAGLINQYSATLKNEYKDFDPNVNISFVTHNVDKISAFDAISTERIVFFLNAMPNGVQNMSAIKGIVETSLNAGIAATTKDNVEITFSVRSSVKSRKDAIIENVRYITEFLGGSIEVTGDYPSWEYNDNSKLCSIMSQTYYDMYGRYPTVETVHAGLECGYFMEKRPEIEAVSFGPDIFGIHTTKEKLSIKSVIRTYNYLVEILKKI
ncbi:MAG: aminoacyl-histidine dipeptidase [Eubacterium sp.]